MEYLVVLFRTVFYYMFINLIYRFLGKREIGELSIMDLIISFLLSELAAISIDERHENMFLSIIPMLALVLIEFSISKLNIKNSKVRDFLEGNPSIIINKGKINFKEMLKSRYNISDLLTELRKNEVTSIEDVSYAILETNGELSVFTKTGNNFGAVPLPIILDGEIQEITLNTIEKDEKWIMRNLKKQKIELKDVFYGFYHDDKLFIIKDQYD